VFLRFYEYNVFGAVRGGGFSMADKQQPHTATCGDGEATVRYPDHGVTVDLRAVETGVELAVRVRNDSDRDRPTIASLDPCLNPGRDHTDTPLVPDLVGEAECHLDFEVETPRFSGGRKPTRWETTDVW